jgi:hypothetical protein
LSAHCSHAGGLLKRTLTCQCRALQELFNDAGLPFEPFHLKREREEGFFDEVCCL